MIRSTMFLATALVTTFAGCAETLDAGGAGGAGGKADGSSTTVTFAEDFSESADGPIVAGQSIVVDYDLDRLTACRGSTNGSEVWGITGWAKFGSAAPKEFALTRLEAGRVVAVRAEVEVPSSATSAELWFTTTNRWGCNAYDSNDGANYAFAVEHRADTSVLAFDADFSESQSAAIRGGDSVVIHYAPERLERCAGSTGGRAAWGITGFYQVDGGTVKQVMVTRADGPDLVAADPQVTVPRGSDLAVWFEATSVWGCHEVDSDYGSNYHYAID
jgi:hypothetical protein